MQTRNLIKCLDLTTLQLLLSIHQGGDAFRWCSARGNRGVGGE